MNVLMRAAAGLGLAALLASPAVAQTKWDLPTPYPDGNFHTKNIVQFAEDVKAATGGSLQITVHANQSLIKHPDIKNAVRSGTVPAGELLVSRLANESPIYEVDSVPFLASSYDAAKKLYAAQKPILEKKLGEQGLMLLFSVAWPPQGIFAKQELNTLADLKGVKFRAYSKSTERVAQLAGMVPVQIEASDIATAFATGRVGAMITSPSTGTDSKVWDFLSHYYDTQAWLPRNMVIVNKAAFDKLSDAEKQAVREAAKKAEERGWEMSAIETKEKTDLLAKNGIKVTAPSDDMKKGFAEIGATMTAEWEKAAGEDGKAILDAYRN
ncbi:TRAP transporter substrate-binding protein [Chelatococcus daeguensis]|uniref:TRAP-type C4-dicarboxylate transport system, periplasmic component n=1 Tax=Chelatococcus sambhunathii TaxID=363953 RepID=A0ABP2A1S8_9HYPH|nr:MULTISPECIES: TRAP transporter substrate-binding protein [Chelatococcus]KZE27425.1 C4-dicarboxylate ABC transporter substrate-binding protein [Chelatococcus daeguensis]MBM3085637.1 TRAP transporter substrate-binding protein [Chelatococcus daeguensis]CUA84294.1 TRAP-type C4-dicarboxylate transport system, periplasmic component [Chelatococcus sambhunathii]